jgi:hypothetical protein
LKMASWSPLHKYGQEHFSPHTNWARASTHSICQGLEPALHKLPWAQISRPKYKLDFNLLVHLHMHAHI